MPNLRPIGLTGAIAGGKSTVLKVLQSIGLRVASSDAVAREVFREDAIQVELAQRLGVAGPVEPSRLREAMVQDPSLRRWTNRLMHPRIGERMRSVEADVIEVPLLFEACLQERYREVWCVVCGPDERTRRLRARYGSDADLSGYGQWQLSEPVKAALSDTVIRTDRPLHAVSEAVRAQAARSFPERIARSG